jgi:hypothetical protein
MAKIFLSHSTEDKPWLIGLVHKLKWLGHKVFIDEPRGVGLPLDQGIPIGQSWYEVLERELKAVDKVLAVWSPAASKKLAEGRGEAFAREIFWAARNRKLLFAYIEQNPDPTEISDAEFYASMTPIDTSSLNAMLARDETYRDDRVVAKALEAQHFRIEGLRIGQQQMIGRCDGVGRLQREVLAPEELQPQRAKPEKQVIEIPQQYLDMARAAIDRSWQLDVVEGLIRQAKDDSPGFATFHVSSNCVPKSVLDRLEEAQPSLIPWKTGTDAQSRRTRLDNLLHNVLGDPVREANDGAVGNPMVIYTTIAVGKDGVKNWEHAKELAGEWNAAALAAGVPPNLPVLFVTILEDKSALGDNPDQYNFTNRPWVPFGLVPSPEVISWAESDQLQRLVDDNGLSSFRDRTGRKWTTQRWIYKELETVFDGREPGPTMRDAQDEAEHLIDQVVRMAAGEDEPGSAEERAFGGVR